MRRALEAPIRVEPVIAEIAEVWRAVRALVVARIVVIIASVKGFNNQMGYFLNPDTNIVQ